MSVPTWHRQGTWQWDSSFGPIFSVTSVAKQLSQKHNVETPHWRRDPPDHVLSRIPSPCRIAHLGDAGHVLYSLSAYRDILLWLLRPGLGKKQGSAQGRVSQIKEGQGANWAEMVSFLWNRSSRVQTSEARLQCGKEPFCMRKLQSVNCYRKPWRQGVRGNQGRRCAFIIRQLHWPL